MKKLIAAALIALGLAAGAVAAPAQADDDSAGSFKIHRAIDWM